jgi:hypothetical protein
MDALGELKCKSLKNSFEPNSPENLDKSDFLAGFQKVKLDMSGPLYFFLSSPDLSESAARFQ